MADTRRGFLARILGGAVAAVCAPFVAKALPLRGWEKDVRVIPNAYARCVDPKTGISIRFIRQWNVDADKYPNSFDVYMVDPSLADPFRG